MPYSWNDFKWGRGVGEMDAEVTTQFEEVLPNGLIGGLIARMHRTVALRESNNDDTNTDSPPPIVRQTLL